MRFALILLYVASSLIRFVMLLLRPGIPPVNLMIALVRIAYSLTRAAYTFFHPDISVKKWQKAITHLKTWLQNLEEVTEQKKQQLMDATAGRKEKTSLTYFDWLLKKCFQLVLAFEKSLFRSTKEES